MTRVILCKGSVRHRILQNQKIVIVRGKELLWKIIQILGVIFFAAYSVRNASLPLAELPASISFLQCHKSMKKLALYAANISRNNVPIEMIEGLLDPYH